MFKSWLDAFQFSTDVQRVVAARLAIIARSDVAAAMEANRMVAEKFVAITEAQVAAGAAMLGGASAAVAAARSLTPIRRRVRANRRRLCR